MIFQSERKSSLVKYCKYLYFQLCDVLDSSSTKGNDFSIRSPLLRRRVLSSVFARDAQEEVT
jgi:hypothetical protein